MFRVLILQVGFLNLLQIIIHEFFVSKENPNLTNAQLFSFLQRKAPNSLVTYSYLLILF
jgi:hypothetical protein